MEIHPIYFVIFVFKFSNIVIPSVINIWININVSMTEFGFLPYRFNQIGKPVESLEKGFSRVRRKCNLFPFDLSITGNTFNLLLNLFDWLSKHVWFRTLRKCLRFYDDEILSNFWFLIPCWRVRVTPKELLTSKLIK